MRLIILVFVVQVLLGCTTTTRGTVKFPINYKGEESSILYGTAYDSSLIDVPTFRVTRINDVNLWKEPILVSPKVNRSSGNVIGSIDIQPGIHDLYIEGKVFRKFVDINGKVGVKEPVSTNFVMRAHFKPNKEYVMEYIKKTRNEKAMKDFGKLEEFAYLILIKDKDTGKLAAAPSILDSKHIKKIVTRRYY